MPKCFLVATPLERFGQRLIVERLHPEWRPPVVQRRSLDDDAEGADEAGDGEDPEKEAIQHESNKLPILFHLQYTWNSNNSSS